MSKKKTAKAAPRKSNPTAKKLTAKQPVSHLPPDPAFQPAAERSPADVLPADVFPPEPVAIPIGGSIPESCQMRPDIPIQFPPDVAAKLHGAAESGRYMLAIFSATEAGDITLFRHTSAGFNYDWWLRSAALLRKNLAESDPPAALMPNAGDGGARIDGQNQNNPAAD